MAIITPTFNLHGQCEEAIKLYQQAFGAKIDFSNHRSTQAESLHASFSTATAPETPSVALLRVVVLGCVAAKNLRTASLPDLIRGHFMLRYSDADPRDFDMPLTEDQKNYVYHAEVYIGEQRLMFSDIIEFDLAKSTALSLTVTLDSAEEVKAAYEIMQEGSTVIYPLKSATYSSCSVSFIDKFGFRWNIMT